MRRPLAITAIALPSLVIGALVSHAVRSPDFFGKDGEGDIHIELPAAVTKAWFPPLSDYDNGGEPLDDELFDQLMAALDVAMTAPETLAAFHMEGNLHLTNFSNRLTIAEITEEQQERISDHFDDLTEKHPDYGPMIELRRIMLPMAASSPEDMSRLIDVIDLFAVDGLAPDGGSFEDRQVEEILARLDGMFRIPGESIDNFESAAGNPFFLAMLLLELGTLTPEQTGQVVSYFEKLKEEFPEGAEFLDDKRHVVENLMPGKVAPKTAGKDTEGKEFSLEEYRGHIVVLIFSGHWCGPCQGEYPYQRAMLELYKDRDDPVVLLGVNSDAVLDTIRSVKKRERLAYRTWWDGHVEGAKTKGPIASEWRVTGWPQIYILDDLGVIRFVGKRGGDIITAVDDLLSEKYTRDYGASSKAEDSEEGGEEAGEKGEEAGTSGAEKQ